MARIGDLLQQGRTFSFEFFPPKTDEALREMEKTLRELEPLAPSFCSVTYGAGGSTRANTLEAVLFIHHETPMTAMPHLTCTGQTRGDIEALLSRYRDEGLENVLALAGDPPLADEPPGDFEFAVELIALAKEVSDFSIGVAAFPEIHPRSPDRQADRRFLAEKLRMADFGVTQFFWTADHYFRMMDELAALGVDTPVIPSVFPIISVAGAKRFTHLNGAEFPQWLADRVDPVADDPDEVRKIGVDVATALAAELLEQDPPGLHLYTMNRASSVRQIYSNLGLIPPQAAG